MLEKILYVEDYFNTDAGYQINELLQVKTKAKKVLITSYDMTPFHKKYDELQYLKDREYEQLYNIKIIRLKVLFKIGARLLLKDLKKSIKRENPDVVFLHGIGDFKDLLFLYGKNDYLTFRDCHMSWVASKNKYAKLYYKFFSFFFSPFINLLNKYEKIYALGKEEKQYVLALGIKENKVEMLPHGYNKNTYYYSESLRSKTRKELNIKSDEILISYIGKFDCYKEPHLCLKVFEMLDWQFVKERKLKFLFLGPQNESYMQTVFFKELEHFVYKDRIEVLPGRKAHELVSFYNASDICFWPRETTLSSIHAQVTGCRVIMEDHESNKERVIETSNLFKIGDLVDAKRVLSSLINNTESNRADFDVNALNNREYHIQVATLIESWEKILLEREK